MDRKRRSVVYLTAALVLVAAAIIQVFLLFGSSTFVRNEDTQTEINWAVRDNLMAPRAVYVSFGGVGSPVFSKVEAVEEHYETLASDVAALMTRFLQGCDFIEGTKADLPAGQLCCVLEYGQAMDESSLASQVALERSRFPDMSFREIWIAPSLRTGEPIRVCFYDPATGHVVKANFGERDWEENLTLFQDLSAIISEELKTPENRYYELNLAFPETFGNATFGRDTQVRSSYYTAAVSEIFLLNGEVNREVMNRYAMTFFAYPDTVSISESGESYFYTNEKISLKLNTDGHMLYLETLTEPEKETVSLSEAYLQALSFLKKDLAATPSSAVDVVYAGYEIVNEEYVFYFDYALDGVRISVSDYVLKQWNMVHPAVVSVRGSKVHRCERYIIAAVLDTSKSFSVQTGWLAMTNEFAESGRSMLSQPELIYYYSGNMLRLSWEAPCEDGTVRRLLE